MNKYFLSLFVFLISVGFSEKAHATLAPTTKGLSCHIEAEVITVVSDPPPTDDTEKRSTHALTLSIASSNQVEKYGDIATTCEGLVNTQVQATYFGLAKNKGDKIQGQIYTYSDSSSFQLSGEPEVIKDFSSQKQDDLKFKGMVFLGGILVAIGGFTIYRLGKSQSRNNPAKKNTPKVRP